MIYKQIKILFNKKQKLKLLILLGASIFATFFELIGIGSIPVFAMLIVDVDNFLLKLSSFISIDFLSNMSNQAITLTAAFFLAFIFLFKNLFLFIILFFQGKLLKQLRSATSNTLYQYYITLPYLSILNKNPGILIRTIETDIANTFLCIQAYIALIKESLVLIAIFILLIIADPMISLTSFLFLGVPVFLFYNIYRKNLKIKGKIYQEELGKKVKNINQSFGLIKETKVMNREPFFFKNFFKINETVERMAFFAYMVSVSPRLFLEVAALSSVAIVSAILIFFERSAETILPVISLLAISVIRFIPALNVITASLSAIRFRKPSLELVVDEISKFQNLKLAVTKDFDYEDNDQNTELKFKKNISVKNISFNYGRGDKMAINNISIDIKKGTSVGIIGRSGSGKSTLVDIMLGLIPVDNGHILVDDKNIVNFRKSWQKQIGYIPQDIYLLDDTIKNNITFGLEEKDIDNKLLLNAIKISQLEKFIDSLPGKLNTIVGNRGLKISGGERQRIGIARSLYKKPDLIILDEATSSLDVDNENKILEEIYENKKDKTLIIVSHRNNTVKYCDSIYVMDNGRIVDQGTFKEILNKYDYLKETKF